MELIFKKLVTINWNKLFKGLKPNAIKLREIEVYIF